MLSVRNINRRGSTGSTATPSRHTFIPMQHHHAAMQSRIVELTKYPIRIKQLMLDLYNWQLQDKTLTANAYYAKVITANEITTQEINERHRGKHGISYANLKKLEADIVKLRSEMMNYYIDTNFKNIKSLQKLTEKNITDMMNFINKQVKIVLDEILYNDHFIFELMTDLMLKAELSVDAAAKEVGLVLNGAAPQYLADDEVYMDRLSEISNASPVPGITNKRYLSPLETDYALSTLRLRAVKGLMEVGYSVSKAFDEVCQSEGDELLGVVNQAKERAKERAAAALQAAASSTAEKNSPPQLLIGKPIHGEVEHAGHSPAKTSDEGVEKQKKDDWLTQKEAGEAAANAAFLAHMKSRPDSIANTHVLPGSRMVPASVGFLLCLGLVVSLYCFRRPLLFVAGQTLGAAESGINLAKATASYLCGNNKNRDKEDDGDEENQGLIIRDITTVVSKPLSRSTSASFFRKTTSPTSGKHNEEGTSSSPTGIKRPGIVKQ
jgi:hypothetical protein